MQLLRIFFIIALLGSMPLNCMEQPLAAPTSDSLLAAQQQWLAFHAKDSTLLDSAGVEDLTEGFNELELNQKPHPEIFSLYVRSKGSDQFVCIKDQDAQLESTIRLYGKKETSPNYTTKDIPTSPPTKQSLVHPRKVTFKLTANHPPSTKSSSYPKGCQTYQYNDNGLSIEFQRGHGIPHADTSDQRGGTRSTDDAENFVPQNSKYNMGIRKSLESDLRRKGLKYKEISIYHNESKYNVTLPDTSTAQVPIPEGFLIFVFDSDGKIERSYYFPNFVDYLALKGKKKYKELWEMYDITGIEEWLMVPAIEEEDVEGHNEKINLAHQYAEEILKHCSAVFKLSYAHMPGKARVALFKTLLEWNMQAYGTLGFTGVMHPICLAYFYSDNHVFYQLDERSFEERKQALSNCLQSKRLGVQARLIVQFLETHFKTEALTFQEVQSGLHKVIEEIEEKQKLLEVFAIRDLEAALKNKAPQLRRLHVYQRDNSEKKEVDGLNFDVNLVDPQRELPLLKKLLGGLSIANEEMAKRILHVIEKRARTYPLKLKERMHLIMLYKKFVCDPKRVIYWESTLKDPQYLKTLTLSDLCLLSLFYTEQHDDKQKEFWRNHALTFLKKNPTWDNFLEIARWCQNSSMVFLLPFAQNKNFQHPYGDVWSPNMPAQYLAHQIYSTYQVLHNKDFAIQIKETYAAAAIQFNPVYSAERGIITPDGVLTYAEKGSPVMMVLKEISDLVYKCAIDELQKRTKH